MIVLQFITKRRFNYFDNACLFLCIGLGGWWWFALFPLAVVSVALEHFTDTPSQKGNQPT